MLPLVLGYHPYELQTLELTDDLELHCHCKKNLISRCNATGEPFFGCAGWQPGQAHTTRNFAQGITDKLQLMQPHLMQMDEELQSEGFQF